MENFTFYTPTKVFFGVDTELKVGEIIKSYGFKRILLHYGKSSIKESGLYDRIVSSLNEHDIEFVDLGGVSANPKLSLVREGIKIVKQNNIEFILAVGGGSVIDSAKSISVGAKVDFDSWLFNIKQAVPNNSLKIGSILTLAAAGSEMSSSCVITNEEEELKRGFNSDFNRPLFAIMNPKLTFSVDKRQTASGIVDIMMHTLERYFSKTKTAELTDSISEALISSVMRAGKKVMKNPTDYESRATLMWASSLSHNDLTGGGKDVFMTCHQLGHEINGIYDYVSHGETLSIAFIAWAKYICKYDINKFSRFATNVLNCKMNFEYPEETVNEGILKTEEFFKMLGMPVRLEDANIPTNRLDEMARKCSFNGTRVLNSIIELGQEEILDIFHLMK